MTAFLELVAKDVQILQGEGGAPFRDFMKQLIRAESHLLGIPAGNIVTDSENMADGGCDLQVIGYSSKDDNGYLTVPTCWQFKGTEKANVAEAVLREEVNKPFAAKLIAQGYGYRMCIADDLTAQDVTDRQGILLEEVRKINPSAPPPLVLGSTSLARWASRFPALIIARRSVGGVQTLKTWGTSVTAETKIYVRNDQWSPVEDTVRRQVDFSFDAPAACIRVRGPAGVGKTRCVYETIITTANAAALCLYTMDEAAVMNLAYTLSNIPEAQALIVADECLNKTRQQLDRILAGARNRVRVIVINNTDEPSYEESPEPLVERLPDEVLDQILKENFPTVPAEARRAYLSLAEGFVRIAADLCKHGDTKGLSELGSYVDSRTGGGDKQRAVQVISLFERVGWKDEFAGQLRVVAELTGWDEKRLREACLEVRRDSPGFIVEGGRYFYVTPEAVARICFGRAWEKWVAADIQGFYRALPSELAELFQLRVRKSASDKIREDFASALEVISQTFEPADLADKKKAEEFLRLVETNPTRFLPVLRSLVHRAPREALGPTDTQGDGWGIRRKLVWTCEHLAPFPEYFYDVELILLHLAIHETEPRIGNNATAIWQQLFRLHLPGTAVPFRDRMVLLKQRLQGQDEMTALLAVRALNGIFARHVTRMGGPPVVAGRIPPADWHPDTSSEERDCLQKAFALLREALSDPRAKVRDGAAKLLIENTRLLLSLGFIDGVDEATREPEYWRDKLPRLLDQIDDFLRWDARNSNSKYIERVDEWKRSLVPDDFATKLQALVGRTRRWAYDGRENEEFQAQIRQLAEVLVQNESLFRQSLDWLFSDSAYHAFDLGRELGRLDENVALFDAMSQGALGSDAPIIRGYILGSVLARGALSEAIRRWLDHIEATAPQLLYAIASSIPNQVEGFERVMRLFESEKIPPRYLDGLQHQLGINFTRDRVIRVLDALLSCKGESENDALATAVNIAASWVENWQSAEPRRPNEDAELWPLLRSVFDRAMPNETMDVYHWAIMARAISPVDPVLVVRKSIAALSEGFYISQEATSILIDVALTRPELVMAELGGALLADESWWRLRIHGFSGLLASLPADTILKWLDVNGAEAAWRIVSNLPRPFLSEAGDPQLPEVTRRVLEKYGAEERVRQEFASPGGIRSYSGDIVGQHLEEARFAAKFLDYPLEPVRLWAQVERESALSEATRWRQQIEERRW